MDDTSSSSYQALSWREAARRLVRHVGIYGFGYGMQRIGAFVLLPIYISRLTPGEYGLLALVSLLPVLLPPLVTLALPNAITRYYHEWARAGLAAGNLGMIWGLSTGSILLITALLDQVGKSMLGTVLVQVPFDPYLRLGLWWACFISLGSCPMLLLRIREESTAFVTVSVTSFFLSTGLVLWAVLSGRGVSGILWMQVLSAASIALMLNIWYLKQVEVKVHPPSMKRAVAFCLPLVPSALLEQFAGRADRFFLDKFVPLADIGVYSVANQLGQAVKFFYDSVKPAWVPFYFRVSGERHDARLFLGRATTFYLGGLVLAGGVVLLLAPEVLRWLESGTRYGAALPLLPILVVSYLLQGSVIVGSLAVQVSEKTNWQPILQLVHLLAVALSNMILIPVYGIAGAAAALLLSSAVLSVLYFGVGQWAYPVTIEWPRVYWLLGLGAGLLLVVVVSGDVPSLVRVLLAAAFALAVLVVLLGSRGKLGALPSRITGRAISKT